MVQAVERSPSRWRLAVAVCGIVLSGIASAADPLPAEMQDYVGFMHPEMMPAEGAAPSCGSLCFPGWDDYAVFDSLYLQRDDSTNGQPLVIANGSAPNPGEFLMTTRSMTPSLAPGFRLMFGRRTSECTGWEAGYVGVYGMYGDALVGGERLLRIPGELGDDVPGFANASLVEARSFTTLNMAEFNLFSYGSEGRRDPCGRMACHRCFHRTSFDWLGGFRWAGLEDQARLGVFGQAGGPPSNYVVNASSNLLGFQFGVRGRTEWRRWAFEGWIKTALAGTVLHQSQSEIVGLTGSVERTARSSSTGGVGMIADMNFSTIYRINRTWGLRAGYNLIWLSGVALAPSQFDFSSVDTSGLGLDHGAGLFLNGGSLGLEARW